MHSCVSYNVTFSVWQRLRVLFGVPVHVSLDITEGEAGKLDFVVSAEPLGSKGHIVVIDANATVKANARRGKI